MPSAHPLGGAEGVLEQLLTSEAANALEWQICYLENGPLIDQFRNLVSDSIVVPCGRTRNLLQWWKASGEIKNAARRFGSDLMLGWMGKGQVYGGLAAWRANIPAAWFQHGLPGHDLLERFSRWLPAKQVFTCSEFVAKLQRELQPSSTVTALTPGVATERFNPCNLPEPNRARALLGLPVEGPIIGIVARMQRWKGVHTVIDATKILLKDYPNLTCVIVGGLFSAEPDYPAELQQQVARLELEGKVVFAGKQTDIPLWMQAMDVVIHASRAEPFGLVVIEAASLGKPIVACAPGGPEEIFARGMKGYLFAFEDEKELARQIKVLLSDKQRYFQENRDIAETFSASSFANRLVHHLTELCYVQS